MKLMLRRRLMMVGGGDIPYDYITDGLILHLDGKWNGGIGTHLVSTDTWVDLSPAANNATSSNGTSIAFGKDYADFTNTCGFIASVDRPAGVSFSIEVWSKVKLNNRYCIGCWGYGSPQTFSIAAGNNDFQYWNLFSQTIGDHFSVTYDKDTKTFKSYHNDELFDTVVVEAPTGSNRATPVIAVNRKFDTNQSWVGQIYCLRYYTKALSADEVAHNYNEDIKRLGR